MTDEIKIRKALVVLSPDLVRPDDPMESALIQRAVSLARLTGCELELFHASHDRGLDHSIFASAEDLRRERERLTDEDATRLAELAARVKDEYASVKHEVRWDSPRTDAILRKIADARPDVVLKEAREQSYILGITTNTDWELARRSPAHLWLVDDDVNAISRVVVAVGNQLGDSGDVTTAADYDLLRTAGLFGETFKANVYPVNAFQASAETTYAAHVSGAAAPFLAREEKGIQEQQRRKHSAAVASLVRCVGFSEDNVRVCSGHPSEVIPTVAEDVDADLIILGAKNIGRLERLLSSVTVEPVLAETNCDILICREADLSGVPNQTKSPVYGMPKFDVERAIVDPERVFESPQQVVNKSDISVEFRRRVLQVWEYDIRADMQDQNEGGPVRDIDVSALDEIYTARALLDMKQEKSANESMMLSGASAARA
jgi:universal stress protein E